MTMAQAATRLGIGRNRLFELLRERRHFIAGNVPDPALRRAGYFRVETRGFVHPGTGRQMQYQRVVVTDEGLFWLRELIRADRNNEAAPAVGGGDCRAADAGAAAGTARAGADFVAADRADASEKRLGATPEPTTSR
jgi:hypothetical protein